MVRRVVVLSGPPGAGKSTVSRALLGTPAWSAPSAVFIEGDTFWTHFARGAGAGAGAGAGHRGADQAVRFRAAMTAMLAAALSYAMFDFDVLLDFSIPPWFLDTARTMAAKRGVPLAFVVLLPDKRVCAARAAARAEGAVADYEARFGSFYADFAAAPAPNLLVPDASANAEAVAGAVQDGLARGAFNVA